jgi:alpha-beta hydrolase superfamily lysophospholipase
MKTKKLAMMTALVVLAVSVLFACSANNDTGKEPNGNSASSEYVPGVTTFKVSDSPCARVIPGIPGNGFPGADDYVPEIPAKTVGLFGKLYVPNDIEEGQKRPVVIYSHGFSATADIGASLGENYASKGIVFYAFDFAGGANNSRSTGVTTLEMSVLTESEDLVAAINHVKGMSFVDPERIYLVGESQGGWVTAYVAERHPDEVKGIMLLYPALNIGEPEVKLNKGRQNMEFPYNPMKGTEFDFSANPEIPAEIAAMMTTYVGEGYYNAVFDGPFEPSRFVDGTMDTLWIYDEIAKFPGDVLIFHGKADPLVVVGSSEKAYEKYNERSSGTVELILDENGVHSRDSFSQETLDRIFNDFTNIIWGI